MPEGEDRYRSMIEWSPEAFNIHRDGQLLYVNQAAVKMFGARSAQELVGKPILDLVHPDFHQITLARAKSILDQGSATTMRELKYLKLDGTAIDVEVQGMPIIFEGKPAALVAMRDITGRKLTEITLLEMNAQLNEKSQLLQTTLDSISQGIFMTDADGRVSTFNHRIAELLDLPESILTTHTTVEELTRYQLERGDFGPAASLVDSDARAYVAAAGKGEIPRRYLRVTPAGRTLEVKTQTLPSGGMVRTFTDVTDYVQAEADRQRLNLLINATHAIARVGGWDADIANNRVFWTEGIYRILETSPEEYTPDLATTGQFFTPASRAVVKASYADVVKQPKSHDFEIEMITAKGRHIWVHSMGATTWEHGRPVKRTAMLQDITERKQAEAAWRENEQRWKLALESTGDGVWDWHIQTGEEFFSKRLKEMYSYGEDEMLDHVDEHDRRTHPDDRAKMAHDRQAHFDGLSPTYVNEHRVRCKDGSWKWVLTRGMIISRDAHGQPLRMIGTHTDITERKQRDAILWENEQRWKLALESIGDGVWDWHVQTGERFSSKRLKEMYGFAEHEELDRDEIDTRTHPDDQAQVLRDRQAHFDGLTPTYVNEHRVRCRDGSWKWVLTRGMVISRDAQGQPLRMIGTHTDITERKQRDAALRENEARWKLALESTGDGMWEWFIQTDEEFFSKSLLKMYGYGDDDAIDPVDKFDQRTHPDDRAQLQLDRQAHFDGLTPTFSNERRLRCKDGSWKWVLSRGMVINRDAQGKPLRMIGTHTDITERKKSETLIWHQAHIDALTGLPNRRMLHERLEQEIKKAKRDGLQLALLFIDLDHFKEVNDTLGHDSGDLLLIEAARRLRSCVRESDSVARMGGDEFTVILTELTEASSADGILQKLLHTLQTVFRLNQETVFISASIGVTIYPHDATEIEDLFKNADQALYVAKGAGRNRFSFFTPALQEAAQNRLRLSNDLRAALTNRQFRMVYQPIVELATGAIRKAEALLRWQHPTRGLVSPGEFIEIAETSGLIVDIGDWVFQQAARQVQAWRARLDPQFQISVNKSPVQFHHGGSVDRQWPQQLEALGLPGQSVVVEITEGLLLSSSASVAQQLLELHDAGIAVSLDDFGTGYSSLSYLQKFDIDFLKIDQSFVRHLVPTSTDLALCKAIIVMAHELGMKVIAEGVESVQQRDLLTAAGCDYGQGYLFARPMAASDFETFLAAKPFN